jgi:hypothetical protein
MTHQNPIGKQGHALRFRFAGISEWTLALRERDFGGESNRKDRVTDQFWDVLCVRYPSIFDFATADCRPSPQQGWRIGFEDRSSRVASESTQGQALLASYSALVKDGRSPDNDIIVMSISLIIVSKDLGAPWIGLTLTSPK